MRDNWDKDPPSEGIKTKINWKCHVSFSRLDCRDLLDYYSVIYSILRIGPRVGVGVGAGVGFDQESGVGAGAGVGTAPPRLCTPAG